MYRCLFFVAVLLILTSPKESNASLTEILRKPVESKENTTQLSPSPSPVSSTNSSTGDGEVHTGSTKPQPIDSVTDERCEPLSNRCQEKNLTACIHHTGNGRQGSFLVQNNGESSLKVNITILPVNTTFKDIELLKHQAKKINISAVVESLKSITLNAGDGDCVISIGSPPPPQNTTNYMQFPSYATYVTPVHGAYLLLLTAMIVGGVWACCKCGPCSKRGRHLEGVPYQELEMGQPESVSGTSVVETSDGWDQGWDDDWDGEKTVKSPGHEHVGNGRANGVNSKSSNGDGWGNDWDD